MYGECIFDYLLNGRKKFLLNFSLANLLFYAFEYRSHDIKFDWIPNWPIFLTSNLTEVDLPLYDVFRSNLNFFGSNLNRIWFFLDHIRTEFLHLSFKIIWLPLRNRVEFLIKFFLPNLTEHLETIPY